LYLKIFVLAGAMFEVYHCNFE